MTVPAVSHQEDDGGRRRLGAQGYTVVEALLAIF